MNNTNPLEVVASFYFAGMKVIEDSNIIEQFRFPRSKRKRIKMKWAKDRRNFRPASHCLVDERRQIIYCHPSFAKQLRKES